METDKLIIIYLKIERTYNSQNNYESWILAVAAFRIYYKLQKSK